MAIVVGGLYGAFVFRFFMQWGIPCQYVMACGGLFWGIELLILYHHQVVLAPHISIFSHVVFLTAFMALVLLSVRMSRTNPVTLPRGGPQRTRQSIGGSQPAGRTKVLAESEGAEEDFKKRILTWPQLEPFGLCDMRYALHHCEFTGKNVCGFDTYIPHLGVCVGQGNRRMFVAVLFFTTLTALLHCLIALNVHSTEICP